MADTKTERAPATHNMGKAPAPIRTPQSGQTDIQGGSLQRALGNAGAASAADILTLQRTAGNRATRRLLALHGAQAKLTVGAADDPYEREADRVADRVMRAVAPSAPRPQRRDDDGVQTNPLADAITPLVQRHHDEQDLRMKPAYPADSFEVGSGFENRLSAATSGGRPLPASTRARMENGIGADFSGVRLHADSASAQLNRELSAQAFTRGSDIFLGEGKDNLASSAGQHLLAHELTHVVQQGAAGDRVARQTELGVARRGEVDAGLVQRKIGFEFEADAWNSYLVQRPLAGPEQQIKENDPAAVNATATTAGGFTAPPRKGHVIEKVGTGMQPGPGPGFELQADEKDADHGDLEFVTKPFEESPQGYDDLRASLEMMRSLMNHIVTMPFRSKTGTYNWPDEHGLASNLLLAFGDRPMKLKPQVTGGIGLDKIGGVMENMGVVPGETVPEATQRAPGRGSGGLLAANTQMAKILGAAPGMARNAINNYLPHRIAMWNLVKDDFQNTKALEGLVAMAVAYVKAGSNTAFASYPKALAPLMSRTEFSTLFEMLPQPQKDVLRSDARVFSGLVLAAANSSLSLGARDVAVTEGMALIRHFGRVGALTVGRWLNGIPAGVDYMTISGYQRMLLEDMGAGALTPGQIEVSGDLEGFGALGTKTDSGNAIVEFRGIPSMLTHMEIEEFALNFHKYVQNVNSKPSGGALYGKQ